MVYFLSNIFIMYTTMYKSVTGKFKSDRRYTLSVLIYPQTSKSSSIFLTLKAFACPVEHLARETYRYAGTVDVEALLRTVCVLSLFPAMTEVKKTHACSDGGIGIRVSLKN